MTEFYTGKHTVQKDEIYEALKSLDHPSATEVYERLVEEDKGISRATVFRVLSQFSECGYIRRLDFSDSDVRYDWRMDEHHHFRCNICRRVYDVFSGRHFPRPRALDGFKIATCEVIFTGICPDCAKKDG